MSDAQNDAGAGSSLGDHWNPSKPNDLQMINRLATRYPKRFKTMQEDGEKIVVDMVKLAAECATKAKASADTHSQIVDAGRLAAAAAAVGVAVVKVQAEDERHAEKLEVDRANAVTNAVAAGVTKVYKGLDPARIIGDAT